jgi:hypothetical protein
MICLNAKIYFPNSSVPFEIGRKNILSMENPFFDRDSVEMPSFGLRSNTNRISFKDYSGLIRDYANQGLLTKDIKTEVFIFDTLKKKTQKIATAFTENWQYDNNTRTVDLTATDGLVDWQSIDVQPLGIEFRNTSEMVVVYEHLREIANQKSRTKVASFYELDERTKNALQRLNIGHPVIEQCSLWAAFSKLCVACMLNLCVRVDGIAQPYYTYGD